MSERSVPAKVVYGVWREETLVVLDDEWALAAARELDLWRAVRTVGEARDLAEHSDVLGPAELPENLEDEPASDPWSLEDSGAYLDGDWPIMPATWTLENLPQLLPLGERVTTTLNGDYLSIDPAREQELVTALEGLGCEVRRDDDLINKIGLNEEV